MREGEEGDGRNTELVLELQKCAVCSVGWRVGVWGCGRVSVWRDVWGGGVWGGGVWWWRVGWRVGWGGVVSCGHLFL
jgi:hypothetical protein